MTTIRTHVVILAAAWCVSAASFSAREDRTVWDGVFTERQAARGQQVYRESCVKCHKEDLLGAPGVPPLVGPAFDSRWNGVTVDDMVQTIRSSMPQEAPDSLGSPAYVDLVAYMLKVNGMPAGDSELPPDRAILKQIQVAPRPN